MSKLSTALTCVPSPAFTSTFSLALPLAATLLLGGCGVLSKDAQEQSTDITAATAASQGASVFDLEIHAPENVHDLLSKHMELQRYRHLPDLRRSELRRLLGAAESNVRDLVATLGYFSPSIELELIDTGSRVPPDTEAALLPAAERSNSDETPSGSSEAPRPRIVVRVEPGTVTTVQSVTVDLVGPTADTPEGQRRQNSLARNWSLETGKPFTQGAWAKAKTDGLRRLQERRYPTASLSNSRADIDADTHQARLQVEYDPGPAYTFGPLVIEGAQRYNPAGAIRLARLPVGEEYRQSILLDTQQRLANSGYYESVFLTLMTDVAQPGETQVQAPVVAQVREALLQKWVYGLGMSTDTGARFSIDHTHNRVPWLGWRALSKLQLDRKNPLISTYLHSMPEYNGWNWFVGAQAERAELADYQANSISLTAGRSKSEDKIDRRYYLQYDYAKPQGTDAPPASSSLSMNYGWTGRYFNNPSNPTRGWGFAWETGAGTTLTPQRDPFARLAARWLYFIPMNERDTDTKRRSRLALRANAGTIIASDKAVIPLTQLFLSGGDTTVRGYSYQSIGARSDAGQLIGGRYMAAGSIEWQRPIIVAGNRSDWEHTLFVDAGTVADEPQDMTLFVGAGSGVRWNSPVGPLQADLAYGLKTQKIRLHLRLGFNF